MSQYIIWAAYAAHKYHPQGIAIAVVGNDFDESLLKHKNVRDHYYFAELPDGKLELHRVDYHSGWIGRLLLHSALAPYVIFNLQQTNLFYRLKSGLSGGSRIEFVADTSNSLDPQRVADSRRVIPAFLEELLSRTGLPPDRLLLVGDGIRPELYSGETAGSDSWNHAFRFDRCSTRSWPRGVRDLLCEKVLRVLIGLEVLERTHKDFP